MRLEESSSKQAGRTADDNWKHNHDAIAGTSEEWIELNDTAE